MTYTIKDARNKLTQLLRAVEEGEQITITRNGKPVAEIIPARRTGPRRFGTMKGLVIDPEWNRPQNDIEAWLRGDV